MHVLNLCHNRRCWYTWPTWFARDFVVRKVRSTDVWPVIYINHVNPCFVFFFSLVALEVTSKWILTRHITALNRNLTSRPVSVPVWQFTTAKGTFSLCGGFSSLGVWDEYRDSSIGQKHPLNEAVSRSDLRGFLDNEAWIGSRWSH